MRPGDGPARTMLGITTADVQTAAQKRAASQPPDAPTTQPMPQPPAAKAPARVEDASRTILGLTSPLADPARGSSTPPPPTAEQPDGTRTMLGVQVDVSQLEQAARERAGSAGTPAPTPATPAPGPRPDDSEPRSRAMVSGLSQPRKSDVPPPPRESVSASTSSTSSSASMNTSTSWIIRRRGAPTGLVIALLVLGVLALAAAVVVGVIVIGRDDGGPRLAVTIARSPAEDTALLDLTLTPFTPGTQVEVLGQKKAAEAGRVRFELPIQTLAVGSNDVPVTIREQGRDPVVKDVRVMLRYRVRPDLSGLIGATPSYALVFEVMPGAGVEIEGQPVVPDSQGRILHTIPLTTALANGPTHTVEFRILTAEGPPEPGRITTTLPVSRLVVDRPSEGAVIEADSIECAGAVDPGATVTVNGQVVSLSGDRFLHRVALPEQKDYTIEIVAAAPGKAPTTVHRSIRRVRSLQAEIEQFASTVDRSLTYARIAGTPAIYRGQRAKFTGSVFNARTEAGVTTLQIQLHPPRDCPEDMRCSLWVEMHGETDARIGDWVDVLGTLEGEQSYQTTRGERLTVPKIDARFVVKRAPPG